MFVNGHWITTNVLQQEEHKATLLHFKREIRRRQRFDTIAPRVYLLIILGSLIWLVAGVRLWVLLLIWTASLACYSLVYSSVSLILTHRMKQARRLWESERARIDIAISILQNTADIDAELLARHPQTVDEYLLDPDVVRATKILLRTSPSKRQRGNIQPALCAKVEHTAEVLRILDEQSVVEEP